VHLPVTTWPIGGIYLPAAWLHHRLNGRQPVTESSAPLNDGQRHHVNCGLYGCAHSGGKPPAVVVGWPLIADAFAPARLWPVQRHGSRFVPAQQTNGNCRTARLLSTRYDHFAMPP